MLRKCISFLLSFVLVTGVFSYSAFADVYGYFDYGKWFDPEQGYRFSIYDTVMCQTVGCVDFLNTESMRCYNNDWARGYSFRIACGNKMDYLHMYRQGVSISELAENILFYGDGVSFPYTVKEYSSNGAEDSRVFNNALRPIFAESIQNDKYQWTAQQNMRLLLSESVDISYVENILNAMGFSIIGDTGYEYFGAEYVLVVEPVFWFINETSAGNFYLYGTATEWALLDQYYYNQGVTFYNGKYRGSIHNTMGNLTYIAAPASCLIAKERVIELGDGTVVKISTSDSEAADLIRYQKSGNYDKLSPEWHERVNECILKNYGAEFITPRDIEELNIDIVSDNTLFRTDSTGMLSFYATSSGKMEYLPDYGELSANSNAYGIKLLLETEPRSDIKLGTIEILSDGMPLNERRSVSTYIFDEFYTPSRAGSWTFKLTAYDSIGNRLNYTSGNGSYVDDGEYIFTVTFMEIPTEYPKDASASDKMPKGFETVDFDISSNPYTAAKAPCTHTEWHYYEAVPYEEKATGQTYVIAFLRKGAADADLQNLYLPKVYSNVATAKLSGGEYQIRAGYGIGIELNYDDAVSTGVQGFEAGLVLFPEYGYRNYACVLERSGDDLVMEMNPYSMYCGDVLYSDYSRVHFTPVWYPDGEYNIVVFLYEYWTPAGMLWDYEEYTIHINGSVYDDWYITRIQH